MSGPTPGPWIARQTFSGNWHVADDGTGKTMDETREDTVEQDETEVEDVREDTPSEAETGVESEPEKASPVKGLYLVTKAELELAKLADTDDPRCSMNYLAVSETRTEVTDGCMALRIEGKRQDAGEYPVREDKPFEPAEETGQVLIPVEDALLVAKQLPKSATIPVLKCAMVSKNELAMTDLGGWTARVFEDEGVKFPRIERAYPKGEAKAGVCLNAYQVKKLMEQVIKFKKDWPRDKALFTLEIYGEGSPIKVEADCEDGRRLTAILMPCRK